MMVKLTRYIFKNKDYLQKTFDKTTIQALEAIHADFKKFWSKYKVDVHNDKFHDKLFQAITAYNVSHL